jgi:hypothetical protein
MPKKDDAIVLTPGSLYRIRSLESREKPLETVGVFKGYAAVAHDTAIVMEVELSAGGSKETLMRLIPAHMIISIDVLKAEKEEELKEKDSSAVSYG